MVATKTRVRTILELTYLLCRGAKTCVIKAWLSSPNCETFWVTRGVPVLPVIQYHWVPEQDTIFHCNCMFKYRNTENAIL